MLLPAPALPTSTTTVVAATITWSRRSTRPQPIPLELACRADLAANLDAEALFGLTAKGLDFYAERLVNPYATNAGRKVLFSRTLTVADWANTTIASGDLAEQIDRLRRGGDGYIVVHGGIGLWRSLARLDLIDEYRVTLVPYVAGEGPRLFEDGAPVPPTRPAVQHRLQQRTPAPLPTPPLAVGMAPSPGEIVDKCGAMFDETGRSPVTVRPLSRDDFPLLATLAGDAARAGVVGKRAGGARRR